MNSRVTYVSPVTAFNRAIRRHKVDRIEPIRRRSQRESRAPHFRWLLLGFEWVNLKATTAVANCSSSHEDDGRKMDAAFAGLSLGTMRSDRRDSQEPRASSTEYKAAMHRKAGAKVHNTSVGWTSIATRVTSSS